MAKEKKSKRFYCKSKDGSVTYTSDDNFMYAETNGTEIRLDLFDKHYYKLRLYNNVPILEVDGLRMQLVKNFKTPLDYPKEVVKTLKIPSDGKHTVLDTCMGLGYTAIGAGKKTSVETVITCEISAAVISLSKWNPLSDALWNDNENISKFVPLHGDIFELIKTFDSEMFSFVIHDPPRFSHAPNLYSSEFYKELNRVCKKNASIFHYVGSVGKTKGRRIDREVMKRLAVAGFMKIKYVPRLQGIIAVKQ